MAHTSSTRKCGNCGTSVGAGAVTCPACDVLLAAYESPEGSIFSTDAATSPVDMTETPEPAPPVDVPGIPTPIVTEPAPAPTTSPTSDTLSALQEQGATRPSFELPQQSPIAKAMEETKAAVDATPQPTSDAEREAIASIIASADDLVRERQEALNVPEEYREDADFEVLGFDTDQDDDDEPDPPAPTRASQSAPRPKPARAPRTGNKVPPSQSSVVNKVRAQAEAGWYDENREQTASLRERPTPAQRAAGDRQPVRGTALSEARPNTSGDQSKTGAWIISGFVGGIILLGILGRAGSVAGMLVPIIVFLLIWYMVSMSKSTGRKTTSIPRDRRPR